MQVSCHDWMDAQWQVSPWYSLGDIQSQNYLHNTTNMLLAFSTIIL